MKKGSDEREIELKKYANELGVSLQGLSTEGGRFLEVELVSRIINAERSQREHRMWLFALIAAVASALSALAAWVAILKYG